MRKQLYMVTATLVLTMQTYSQTIINAGPVSGTWTASGSPYHIMGDINVPAGNTLVIEPGATVKIYSVLSFIVYGQLLAIGNSDDSIYFRSQSTYWKGLQLLNATDTCRFEYCSLMGFKNNLSTPGPVGGGVLYSLNSKVVISNSCINDNRIDSEDWVKGGAICFINSIALIQNCRISNNKIINNGDPSWAECLGGAIFANGSIYILSNEIVNNSIEIEIITECEANATASGGGIYCEGNNVFIEDNIIQGNSCNCTVISYPVSYMCNGFGYAQSFGGGVYGGSLINNIITDNGIYCWGEGYPASEVGGSGHSESKGGGIYGADILQNNIIKNNYCQSFAQSLAGAHAKSYGGGVCNTSMVKNNLITNNDCYSCTYTSTGYLTGHSECYGGGILGGNLINNTIVNNQIQAVVNPGGSIVLYGAGVNSGTIKNCVVYSNTGANQITGANVTYSCVEGGYSGQGNISSNPLFVNPSLGDYHLMQPPCQTQQSPCVDAGDPSTPLFSGTTRTDELPDIQTIDMGYHHPSPYNGPILLADFHSLNPIAKTDAPIFFYEDCYSYLTEITQYEWDFENDGIIDSYEVNPAITYSEPANYSVKLIITGEETDDLLTDTLLKENYINVCYFESGFQQDTASGLYPLLIQFTDTSDIINTQISSWQWDFDNDGIIDSYLQNPEFVYENLGLYSVKLVITDSSGYIKDTTFKEALVNVNGIEADFEADQEWGYIPLSVNFNNTSINHNAVITEWAWDFQNDGITDSYEENPTWTYTEIGYYSVKLIITGQGANEIVKDTIIKENFIAVVDIIAGFHSNINYGHSPLQVHFYDDSYIYPINLGQINSWMWDFQNDGQIDDWDENPTWVYNEPGVYSVKLIVADISGNGVDSIVTESCLNVCKMIPEFSAEPLSGYNPLEVHFYDSSLTMFTQIATWKWDFQHDGLIDAYGPYPTWTYPDTGIYSVELRITDTSGQIWKSVVKEDYIQVNSVTGIPYRLEENVQNKLKIYPNPFTSDLIIEFEFDKPDMVTVQVFDVAFKPVATIVKSEKVDIGNKIWKWEGRNKRISSGIYNISLTTSSGKQYLKKCIKLD